MREHQVYCLTQELLKFNTREGGKGLCRHIYPKKNMTNIEKTKEIFGEMLEKATSKHGKFDYISIKSEKMAARIFDSKICPIKNCIIIVEKNGKTEVWKIHDYKKVCCPEDLILCVKNTKNMGAAIGNAENMLEYFLLKTENPLEVQFEITGVVEIEEYEVVFYFDWKNKSGHYLLSDKETEDSDLFQIMEKMLSIKEVSNEQGYSPSEW